MNYSHDPRRRNSTISPLAGLMLAALAIVIAGWIAWQIFDGLKDTTKAFLAGALFAAALVGPSAVALLFIMRNRYRKDVESARAQMEAARQRELHLRDYVLQQAVGRSALESHLSSLLSRAQPPVDLESPWRRDFELRPPSAGADGDDLAKWPEA
jgi:hypothetical protein